MDISDIMGAANRIAASIRAEDLRTDVSRLLPTDAFEAAYVAIWVWKLLSDDHNAQMRWQRILMTHIKKGDER